jgi:hypothetical protein
VILVSVQQKSGVYSNKDDHQLNQPIDGPFCPTTFEKFVHAFSEPNEKEISHGRVSWQRCWRSFLQGYSLRYRLQLLLRPLKVLLHSCPARRRLLLEISVTSVGVEKRKLLLNR